MIPDRWDTCVAVLHEAGVHPPLNPVDPVDRAVVAFYADITDRRGLRHEWDRIDRDVICEIISAWRSKIRSALEGA